MHIESAPFFLPLLRSSFFLLNLFNLCTVIPSDSLPREYWGVLHLNINPHDAFGEYLCLHKDHPFSLAALHQGYLVQVSKSGLPVRWSSDTLKGAVCFHNEPISQFCTQVQNVEAALSYLIEMAALVQNEYLYNPACVREHIFFQSAARGVSEYVEEPIASILTNVFSGTLSHEVLDMCVTTFATDLAAGENNNIYTTLQQRYNQIKNKHPSVPDDLYFRSAFFHQLRVLHILDVEVTNPEVPVFYFFKHYLNKWLVSSIINLPEKIVIKSPTEKVVKRRGLPPCFENTTKMSMLAPASPPWNIITTPTPSPPSSPHPTPRPSPQKEPSPLFSTSFEPSSLCFEPDNELLVSFTALHQESLDIFKKKLALIANTAATDYNTYGEEIQRLRNENDQLRKKNSTLEATLSSIKSKLAEVSSMCD